MRYSTKVVIDIATGEVTQRDSHEYHGPVAQCISAGLGGSGQKTKSKSQSQSTNESGVNYNPDFLKMATEYAGGTGPENFNAAEYLKQNPDVAKAGVDPYEHYLQYGQKEGRKFTSNTPDYNPAYVQGAYTSVAPEGFDTLESNIYGSQQSKLKQAYDQSVARQREELAQMGGLNSPSQYLEGSARSSIDRGYLTASQQAARDASLARLGAQQTEAARRTAFDTGEAGRQTQFNQQTQQQIIDDFMKKLALAIQSGQYSKGQSSSSSASSGISGSGNIQGSFLSGGSGGGGGSSSFFS